MAMSRARFGMLAVALGSALTAAFVRLLPPREAGAARLVRIAAASDLRFALDELAGRLHDGQPDVDLRVSYGSSGTFFAQLVNGASFDLFVSADVDYPRRLASRGLTVPGTEFIYAVGRLALWVPSRSPLDIEHRGLQALTDPAVRHVAIANPAHAPYGRAAEAAMHAAGVDGAVRSRLVLGENVSQAMQFVQSGAAEAGLVALSLALAPAVGTIGRFWIVPIEMYPRIDQGGVILKGAVDMDAARRVRSFLMSEEARSILRRYGFFLPGG